MSIFSKLFIKSGYKSAYGDKAKINIGEHTIEVYCGNRKIVHNKENSNKIEETFFEANTVRVVKYDEGGHAILEETYVDGEKESEKALGNGKSTKVEVSSSGLEISNSKYFKEGIEYKETAYKFHNKVTECDFIAIVIESEEGILKSIVKKSGENVIVDVQKKLELDGRVKWYKFNDLEVEVDYYGEGKAVKRFSKHWEEPIYEEEQVNNRAKKNNKEDKNIAKKVIGTKIKKQIVEYDKRGSIVHIETENDYITREFDDNGNLKKQYNIIQGKQGKEIVGKIITETKDIKIIDNSTLPKEQIVALNESMDTIEYKYGDNLVMMYDFIVWDGGLEITEDYCKVNNSLEFNKRVYDKIENGVPYHFEEKYRGGQIYATKMTNNISKTEFYSEGNKRMIKGYDGRERDVEIEEFELYKMADELNKI